MVEIDLDERTLPWEQAPGYPTGALRKVLRTGADGNPLTIMLKLPPGFEMAPHSHVCTEQHYVLEGEYEVQQTRCSAGHYCLIPAHADHGPFRCADGAVVLVIWD
jgi:anti-sigma factor ChrR (cupin superfamily)